ncbi:hypothetical protein WJ968_37220 [Achromobacter xylosoxidans]
MAGAGGKHRTGCGHSGIGEPKAKGPQLLAGLGILGGASLMKPQFTEKLFKIRLLDVVCSVLLAKKWDTRWDTCLDLLIYEKVQSVKIGALQVVRRM